MIGGIVGIVLLITCAGPGSRLGTIDHNVVEVPVAAEVEISPELRAALLKIDELEAKLAEVEIAIGDLTIKDLDAAIARIVSDIKIGGEGDSVTTWMLVLTVAAALFYPVIGRPARLKIAKWRGSKDPRIQGS